ncbi:MFS transporter [Pseudomonas serbica]
MKKHSGAWIVFLLFSGLLITGIDRSNISVTAPKIMSELGMDATTMGIVFSSFFWGYVLFNIPSGVMADRYGSKIVYGIAAIIWAVTTLMTGWASSLIYLIICRFALGVGEAAVFPISAKIVNENFGSEVRGTVTGIYFAGYRLGMALSPIGIAYVMNHYGWRVTFDIAAVLTGAWVILWFATYPKDTKNVKSDKKVSWSSAKKLLLHRSTWALIAIKFLTDYLTFMIISWLPVYLFMERKFSIVKMGIYSSLPWIAGMILLPIVGRISDRLIKAGKSKNFGRKVPIVTCQLLAATIIFTPWVESEMVAVILLIFVVGVESAVGGLIWTFPMEISPPGEAGTLGGIMNTAGSFAGILAPIVTGAIVAATGSFNMAFVIASIGILLSAFFVVFVLGDLKPMVHKDGSSELKTDLTPERV